MNGTAMEQPGSIEDTSVLRDDESVMQQAAIDVVSAQDATLQPGLLFLTTMRLVIRQAAETRVAIVVEDIVSIGVASSGDDRDRVHITYRSGEHKMHVSVVCSKDTTGDLQAIVQVVGEESEPSRKFNWVPAAIAVGIAVLVVIGVVFGLSLRADTQYRLSGEILVDTGGSHNDGGPCSASGGYSDMREGAAVVVKNGSGEVLATGHLNAGRWIAVGMSTDGQCNFTWDQIDIPESKFYSVEVSHRGAQTYSLDELRSQNFKLSLSLG